jgi:hypothetical protein
MDANCRVGPDLLHGEYGYLMEGETAEAVGRLADNSWFRIQIEGLLEPCWTNTAVLEYAFEPAALPILSGPPLWGGISGLVWHDLCSPGEHGATPTPGCVPLGGLGGYGANGIYESGEPGIAGVLIHLGSGACPSTGLSTTTSGATGGYSFSGLAPGTYCVSSNVLENASILVPGGWTYPNTGEWARHTVVVTPGDMLTGINFGFDYQFLP